MKYYYCDQNDTTNVVYENNNELYPVFVEKFGNERVDLNVNDLTEVTGKKEIEALDKYLNPYEDNKPKVYMAGPLFNEGDRYTNKLNSDYLRDKGFTTFLPQEVVIDKNSSILVKAACFYMDFKAIDQCDYLIANCNGIDIDSGTAAEIGLAYGMNKKIYLYKSDVRNYYNDSFRLNNFVGGLVNNIVYYSIEEIYNDISLKQG